MTKKWRIGQQGPHSMSSYSSSLSSSWSSSSSEVRSVSSSPCSISVSRLPPQLHLSCEQHSLSMPLASTTSSSGYTTRDSFGSHVSKDTMDRPSNTNPVFMSNSTTFPPRKASARPTKCLGILFPRWCLSTLDIPQYLLRISYLHHSSMFVFQSKNFQSYPTVRGMYSHRYQQTSPRLLHV
jgi:hypothetical protein